MFARVSAFSKRTGRRIWHAWKPGLRQCLQALARLYAWKNALDLLDFGLWTPSPPLFSGPHLQDPDQRQPRATVRWFLVLRCGRVPGVACGPWQVVQPELSQAVRRAEQQSR